MADDLTFAYRLPLTYVRITGTRTETRDSLRGTTSVDCRSTVTTECGADLLTRFAVRLAPERWETQKTSWSLLEDGRLTGTEVTTTVDQFAGLKGALSAGLTVLGAAGPPLLAAGPPGWVALAGLAGAAVIGAGIAGGGLYGIWGGAPGVADGGAGQRPEPQQANPASWDVHPLYVEEKEPQAQVLANYRAAVAGASAAHAQAVRMAADFSEGAEPEFWARRAALLERVLASATVGGAQAEAAYAAWQATKIEILSEDHDERLRIDVLPSPSELEEWAADPSATTRRWTDLAQRLQVAVTVRLERLVGDNGVQHQQERAPLPSDDVVRYRQPRPALVETWKVLESTDGEGAYSFHRESVQRLLVTYPGNEADLTVRPDGKASSRTVLTFGDSGALLKVGTERTDPALQRAQNIAALGPALKDAAEVGSALRTALAPASLVERAAEAKAAQELGIVPTAEDPLQELREQVAEQELRTRLRLAQQLSAAASPPVFVAVRVLQQAVQGDGGNID